MRQHVEKGKPFFGICVGLQALFEGSEEAEGVEGMGIVKGALRRFDSGSRRRKGEGKGGVGKKSVPCIGWNDATTQSTTESQGNMYGLRAHSKYYYVHSYFVPYTPGELEARGWTVATATYGDEMYVGALGRGNVFATQFHPEKSGAAGLRVIKAFLEGRMWSDPAKQFVPKAIDHQNEVNGGPSDTGTNGLTRRIIACLDVRTNDAGDLVVTKGDQYDVREKSTAATSDPVGQVRNLGKPVDMAKRYYAQGADEITFLNITSFRDCPLSDLPMPGDPATNQRGGIRAADHWRWE